MIHNLGTCLQHAVQLDYVDFVKHFSQEGDFDPNVTCEDNLQPPIFIACSNLGEGTLEIVKSLLDQDKTRIDMSIQESNKNIFHTLFSDKYDVDGSNWERTKLIYQILKLFFEKRPDQIKEILNEPLMPRKDTPLHMACWHQGQELIKLLLSHGAGKSLFKQNTDGEIPANLMLTNTLRDYLDQKIDSEGRVKSVYVLYF